MPVVNGIDVRSGINGSCLFTNAGAAGVETLPIVSWTFNPIAEKQDFRNSKSGGYVVHASTFKDGSGKITFDWDFLNPPLGTPLNIFPGITLTNVGLYVDKTVRAGWFCYQILLVGVPTQLVVAGKPVVSFDFLSAGVYAVGS